MGKCISKQEKTFSWIDKLGVPLAKEGQPDEAAFPPPKNYRVQIAYKENPTCDDDAVSQISEETSNQTPVRKETLTSENGDITDGLEPFKRLDQLGIPRARRENSPACEKRAPSSPLPSPVPDYEGASSSDEDFP